MSTDDPSIRKRTFDHFRASRTSALTPKINSRTEKQNLTDIKTFFKRVEAHMGLIIILFFTLIANFSNARAAGDEDITALAGISTDAIADTVVSINQYTNNLEPNRKQVTIALSKQSDENFISTTNSSFSTQLTEEPAPPPPPVAPRTGDINYTIAVGDTLSQIADRYNLKSTTLQYSNKLNNPDDIQPGQTIKIPLRNLSDSAIVQAQNKILAKNSVTSSRQTITRNSTDTSYGFRVPISSHGISRGITRRHTGIDYMASVGTPVHASASGTISEASSFGWNYGWGKNIGINHGNGRATRYAHLSRISVSIGESVAQGEVIGYSGNTGNSTGPHLHFQLDVYGHPTYPF